MKKFTCIILCLALMLLVTSCTTEYIYNEDDARYYNETNLIASLYGISCDTACEIYLEFYPTSDTVVYIPKNGEYTTAMGERFSVAVADTCKLQFHEDSYYSRLCFDITVYDANGNLLFEKNDFCSYVQSAGEEIDLSYISEVFRPYWKAMISGISAE